MNPSPWKAPFMRWFEQDFWSLNVRKLPTLARLMYRSLLQAAWHSDKPPYAPNNDTELMAMADAPSADVWEEHKAAILRRLQKTEDGKWLYHPKSLAEYNRVASEHQRKGDGPRRRHASMRQSGTFRPIGRKDVSEESQLVSKDTDFEFGRSGDKRGCRIPEAFAVTDAHRTYSREHNLPDPDPEIERFKDYWRGIPGKRGIKTDWDATFRNWLRNAADFKKPAGAEPAKHETGALDRIKRELGSR